MMLNFNASDLSLNRNSVLFICIQYFIFVKGFYYFFLKVRSCLNFKALQLAPIFCKAASLFVRFNYSRL